MARLVWNSKKGDYEVVGSVGAGIHADIEAVNTHLSSYAKAYVERTAMRRSFVKSDEIERKFGWSPILKQNVILALLAEGVEVR